MVSREVRCTALSYRQTHFFRQVEAQLFIEGTGVLGGVEDEIVEILATRPTDDLLH